MRLINADAYIEWLCGQCENHEFCEKTDKCTLVLSLEAEPTVDNRLDAKRVNWSGWKGYRYTRYYCPNCNKPVRRDDRYCHRCGQHLLFPIVRFTPYVEGQKQEEIITWEGEEQ